jgi:hypothetical protein
MKHTGEELLFSRKRFFVDSWVDDTGVNTVKVLSQANTTKSWFKILDKLNIYIDVNNGPIISPEIDDAITAYMEHNGFAGLTPVEYIRSLGLI